MQDYINQFIEEIKLARCKIDPPLDIWNSVDMSNPAEIEDISYVEQFFNGEGKKLSEITGIDTIKLPSFNKLNNEQAAALAIELEKLLIHFNFYPDFPDSYPDHFKYDFFCQIWENEYVPLSFGESHIEFCDYEEETCPFPDYCSKCADLRKEEEDGSKEDFQIDIDNLLPKI